jgi:hypothetical protein
LSCSALRSAGILVGVTGLFTTGLLGTSAAAANATEPCVSTADGSTVTCTYAGTGIEQAFVVPEGVTSVDVIVTRSVENPEADRATAARPSAASGTLAVTPGSMLLLGFGDAAEFTVHAASADQAPGLEAGSPVDSGTSGDSAVGGLSSGAPVRNLLPDVVDSWWFVGPDTDRVAFVHTAGPVDLTLRDVAAAEVPASRGGTTPASEPTEIRADAVASAQEAAQSVVPASVVLSYAVPSEVLRGPEAPASPETTVSAEAPAPAEVPVPTDASASPEVTEPVVPEDSASPEVTEPVVPDASAAPEVTVPTEIPAVPETPAVPEATGPVAPASPQVMVPAEIPAVPEAPASPEVTGPAVPEAPAGPQVTGPVVTGAPGSPEVTAPVDVPAVTEALAGAEVAVPVETPTVPEATALPEVPLPVEAPAARKAPASALVRSAAPTTSPGIQAGSPDAETAEPLVAGDLETAASAVPSALFDTSGVGLIGAVLGGMVAVAVCAGAALGIRQRRY